MGDALRTATVANETTQTAAGDRISARREIAVVNDAGSTLATYVYGLYIDEALRMRRDVDGDGVRESYFYHRDDLYSVMAVSDASGAVVERYDYGDYGAPTVLTPEGTPRTSSPIGGGGGEASSPTGTPSATTSLIGNPYLFTGRRWDPELELYYYRTRFMNPHTGRFTSVDTIGTWGDPGNLGNGYGYASTNPNGSVDPRGTFSRVTVKNCNGFCGCNYGTKMLGRLNQASEISEGMLRQSLYEEIWLERLSRTPGGACANEPKWDVFKYRYKGAIDSVRSSAISPRYYYLTQDEMTIVCKPTEEDYDAYVIGSQANTIYVNSDGCSENPDKCTLFHELLHLSSYSFFDKMIPDFIPYSLEPGISDNFGRDPMDMTDAYCLTDIFCVGNSYRQLRMRAAISVGLSGGCKRQIKAIR